VLPLIVIFAVVSALVLEALKVSLLSAGSSSTTTTEEIR